MASLDVVVQVVFGRKVIEVALDLTRAGENRGESVRRLKRKGVVVRRHVACATRVFVFVPGTSEFGVFFIYLLMI